MTFLRSLDGLRAYLGQKQSAKRSRRERKNNRCRNRFTPRLEELETRCLMTANILVDGFEGALSPAWKASGNFGTWVQVDSNFGLTQGTHSGNGKLYCCGVNYNTLFGVPSYNGDMHTTISRNIDLTNVKN